MAAAFSRTDPKSAFLPVAIAGSLIVALLWGCAPGPGEDSEEPEMVEVGPSPDSIIDPEADPKARPRGESIMAGILPGDFPQPIPVYEPSSLTDHGDTDQGLRYVELTVPEQADRVESVYRETLLRSGFEAESTESEGITRWLSGEVAIRVSVTSAGHEAILRIEYPPS